MEDEEPSSWKLYWSNVRTCVSVSPWVAMVTSVMVAIGLPVWVIFTRRALAATADLAESLLGGGAGGGGQLYAVDQLSRGVWWATGAAVVAGGVVMGAVLLLALLRMYQGLARLPITQCAAPGAASYGTFAGAVAVANFGAWLALLAVALVLAAQLSWLTLMLLIKAALATGVTPSASSVAPQAYADAAEVTLRALAGGGAAALLPANSPLAAQADRYAAAARQGDAPAVCPLSCLDLGSFAPVIGAASACACAVAERRDAALELADDAWQCLVHALAALALVGLAVSWLVPHLSAEYAHARRDAADARARRAATATTRRLGDSVHGAVYVTTNPAFSPKKGGGASSSAAPSLAAATAAAARRAQADTLLEADASPRAPLGAAADAGAGLASALLPESIVGGGAGAGAHPVAAARAELGGYYSSDRAAAGGAAGAGVIRPEEVVCVAPPGFEAAAATAAGAGAAAADGDRAPPNTTAQRYAAYRLRAAQQGGNAASKPPGERAKWSRF